MTTKAFLSFARQIDDHCSFDSIRLAGISTSTTPQPHTHTHPPNMSVSGFRHHFVQTREGPDPNNSTATDTAQSTSSTSTSTSTSMLQPPTQHHRRVHTSETTVSFRHHFLSPPATSSPTQSDAIHTWLQDQALYRNPAPSNAALETSCRQGALAAAKRLNSQLRARKTPSPSPAEPSSPVESQMTERMGVERLVNEDHAKSVRPKQVAVLRLVRIPSRNSV